MMLRFSVESISAGQWPASSEEFCYFLILEGSGSCYSQHKHFILQLHDVLAVPQNTEMKIITDEPLLCGCIHVSDMNNPRPGLYHLPGEHTGFLRQLFYLALDIQTIDRPYYDTVRNNMHQLVFSALIAAELASNQLNPVVVSVAQTIDEQFTDPDFDLHKVIEQTGYTVNHFRKLFRDEVGMPPLVFLNNRRLDYAKELFHQWKDRLPVAEVAHSCGFRDEYYFSRYFKKQEGKTPGQYISELC